MTIINQYFLRDFNPAYAEITPTDGKGVCFGYCDPYLAEQIKELHNGDAPEDIIITITDKTAMLCVVYASEDIPTDEDRLELSSLAGLRLLLWAAEQQTLMGEEALNHVQRRFLQLAFEPSNNISVSLEWLNDTQRKAVYRAYEVTKMEVC